jgi:predicted DNA-binding protein with PD1-like motif
VGAEKEEATVEHSREDELIIVRLDRGEDVIPSLLAALKAEGARGAVVLTGLGALTDVEFAYYDPASKSYDRKKLDRSHELLSLSGIIATGAGGEFQPHFHVTLGAPDHSAVGGHLFGARVSVLAEFALRAVANPKMRRQKEPEFGLNALHVR